MPPNPAPTITIRFRPGSLGMFVCSPEGDQHSAMQQACHAAPLREVAAVSGPDLRLVYAAPDGTHTRVGDGTYVGPRTNQRGKNRGAVRSRSADHLLPRAGPGRRADSEDPGARLLPPDGRRH